MTDTSVNIIQSLKIQKAFAMVGLHLSVIYGDSYGPMRIRSFCGYKRIDVDSRGLAISEFANPHPLASTRKPILHCGSAV